MTDRTEFERGAGSLADRVRGHRVYLDANALIYSLEGEPALKLQMLSVLALFDAGEAEGVTSEMALAEVLVMPYRQGADSLVNQYERLLTSSPQLATVPATLTLWRDAARLRASTPSLRLPDALHAATAQAEGCVLLLTGDRRLAKAAR